jgi:hypothetical protein
MLDEWITIGDQREIWNVVSPVFVLLQTLEWLWVYTLFNFTGNLQLTIYKDRLIQTKLKITQSIW